MVLMIPLVLNVAAAWSSSVILAGISMVAIPVVVALLPDARHHENMFTFFITAVSTIPTNLRLMRLICDTGLWDGFPNTFAICFSILLYWIIFNCEQIALGFVSRAIWPRQYQLFHIKEEFSDE